MKKPFNFRHKILLKKAAAKVLSALPQRQSQSLPPVTVFISSMNTRFALELTLRSLVKHVRYPDWRLIIGENGSTDSSLEFLNEFAAVKPHQLIQAGAPRRHYLWLDEIHSTVDTPYWIACDSDMLFTGGDVIMDMVAALERNPDLYLVHCEYRAPQIDHPAPVTGEPMDIGEALGTWLFCVRTSLREKVSTSFEDSVERIDGQSGKAFSYDTGGRLLRDMRAQGLKYAAMPKWFQFKYAHFGGLSWSLSKDMVPDEVYQRSKQQQVDFIRHCVERNCY